MIKATGRTRSGEPVLILGLSGENMARLMADEPILVDTGELEGLPALRIAIVGGRTEETILDALTTAFNVNGGG